LEDAAALSVFIYLWSGYKQKLARFRLELAKYRTESQLEIKDALQIWLVLFVPAPQVNKNAKSCKRKVGLSIIN